MSIVLGSVGTTVMVSTTSGYSSAARSNADQKALALAEAGLNNALSTLYNSSKPSMPDAVPLTSFPLEGGTVTYSGTLDQETNVWTLRGFGTVPSPTHASDVIRSASAKVRLGSSVHGSANNAVWNYMYSDAQNECMSVANSVNINVPLYVRGDLCMANSASITGYQLQVGGSMILSNTSHVGSSIGTTVHDAHIGGGCSTGGSYHSPCSGIDRVWSQVPADAQPEGLTKPPVDMPGWYQNAQPGPMHGCTQGSFPGGFDTDTVMNGSRGTVSLASGSAYDCRVLDGQGNLLGRISWTPGSPGTLVVSGTIFIDGNISFGNLTTVVYQGRATIYASGTVTIGNHTTICGVAGCGTNWDANTNLLAFVAGSSSVSTGFSISNNSTFQGAVYAVNDYSEANSTEVWGPVIARQLYVANSSINHYVPMGTLLPGMPQSYETTVTLMNEPASWGS